MFWLGFVVGLLVVGMLLLAGFVVAACTAGARADEMRDFYISGFNRDE